MKEYKVAFLKLAFAYLPAVLFSLVVGVAFQMLVVDFLVNVVCQPRTVHSSHGISSGTVGNSYPAGRFYIQTVIVFHGYVHVKSDSGLCQLAVIVTWGTCSA